jgi:hypothetical protein
MATRWRRAKIYEALKSIPVFFALAMVVGLAFDLVFDGSPDFEGSFFRALYFAIAMPIAFLLVKHRVVEMADE